MDTNYGINLPKQYTSKCSIPLLFKYILFYLLIVGVSVSALFAHKTYGSFILSIIPGICIIGCFTHFLVYKFKDNPCAHSIFKRKVNYFIGIIIYLMGMLCIIVIIILTNAAKSEINPQQHWLQWLQFPHNHRLFTIYNKSNDMIDRTIKCIVSPILDALLIWLLLSLTIPIKTVWNLGKNINARSAKTYYEVKSLLIMYIAVCAAVGLAMTENFMCIALCESTDSIIGVSVALCPYDNYGFSDQELSLQDYMIDSITRGLFDVPFHCLTACIMALLYCKWVKLFYSRLGNKKSKKSFWTNICLCLWCVLGIVCTCIPILLHHLYGFWSEAIPCFVQLFLIIGCFSGVIFVIYRKYRIIQAQDLPYISEIKYNVEHCPSVIQIDYNEPKPFRIRNEMIMSDKEKLNGSKVRLDRLEEMQIQNQIDSDHSSDDEVILGMETAMGPPNVVQKSRI